MTLLQEGQQVRNTFLVERFLGEGAFAEVYRVHHRFLGRQAMKVFKATGLIGYIEGAPPSPMANLTNKASYAGATSVSFTAPTSVTLKYQQGFDYSNETKWDYGDNFGVKWGFHVTLAPLGFGVQLDHDGVMHLDLTFGASGSTASTEGGGWQNTAQDKLDEQNKYTVKMQGSLAPTPTTSLWAA